MLTIITTDGAVTVDGTRWRRDDDGNLFVYDTPADLDTDPILEADAEAFGMIFNTDAVSSKSDRPDTKPDRPNAKPDTTPDTS